MHKHENLLVNYEHDKNEIDVKHKDINNLYSEIISEKQLWEQTQAKNIEIWDNDVETLKAKIIQSAEETVEKKAKQQVTKLVADEFEVELKLNGKIGSAMQNMQKDILQFMGIFVAIFALISLNMGHAESWSLSDFFHMNIVITASMTTLLFLISVIINGKNSWTCFMGILTAVLWSAAAFLFFVFPFLKDEIIFFWATYYKYVR